MEETFTHLLWMILQKSFQIMSVVYDYRNLTLHDGQVLVVVISRLIAIVTVLYSYDHEERLIFSSLNIFITFLGWFGCAALSL